MSGGSKKSVPDIPTEATFLGDPIAYYKNRANVYPSNAEVWWSYRRPIEIGTDSSPKSYLEVFDPSLRHQITTGNSPAPKGHYILKAFHQDRSAVSAVSGMPIQSSGAFRPSCTAFFAGRVFYGGVNVAGFNTKVFFSQILERPEQIQMCYQAADPTDEDIRDLTPADGGVIVIPELTEVYHMQVMGQSLFIFARNGVWQIAGSDGIGFRANDYSVTKISGVPSISPMSFVSAEGTPMWWNKTGIYALTLSQIGAGQVQSLTDETIEQFIHDIPDGEKYYVKGAYDPLEGIIQWLYRSTEAASDAEHFVYDRILVFNTKTGAFYPHEIGTSTRVETKGIFAVEGFATEQVHENVVVNGVQVQADSVDVVTLKTYRHPIQSKIKYIVNVLPEDAVPEPPSA